MDAPAGHPLGFAPISAGPSTFVMICAALIAAPIFVVASRPIWVLITLIPQSNPRCTNNESNLVLACRACNSSRKDRPWRQFATAGAVQRIERQRRRRLNMDLARALGSDIFKWSDR